MATGRTGKPAGGSATAVGGDQIEAAGPVATHGSALSTGSGTAFVGNGNTVVPGTVQGDFLAPGATKIVQDSAAERAKEAEARARRCYLERLRRQCQVLPLAALGGDETGDQDLTLDQVYIDLDTTTRVPLTAEEKRAGRKCAGGAGRCGGRDGETRGRKVPAPRSAAASPVP